MKKRMGLWTALVATVVVSQAMTGWVQFPTADYKTTPATGTKPTGPAAKLVLKAEKLLQAGIRQGEKKDFSGATSSFRQALDLDPANKLAWYNLGVIAQENHRTADARAAYDNALKIDPDFKSALYNKAVLLESSDTDEAIALLEHIVGTDPQSATAYLHLGKALAKEGRDGEAEDAFGFAVRADPSLQQFVPEQFRDSTTAASTGTQAGTSR
ncbi:tetratricopeptide repeat protein [Streptomyces sp. NBC_00576]|uniref:tetratricopeptide repeat protein n=1 Tax=Streptomyces sp. NBC_00576 TaxID=2903665 RepID=UPI002E803863|nr:tetratricopeptide repeat protein [Streptomyces sp. NBC_00576]WUB73184.1 tetratricopeptide repeat protein [Streptomyces sp. NBC_00576]